MPERLNDRSMIGYTLASRVSMQELIFIILTMQKRTIGCLRNMSRAVEFLEVYWRLDSAEVICGKNMQSSRDNIQGREMKDVLRARRDPCKRIWTPLAYD
jgi:hypothetical protein